MMWKMFTIWSFQAILECSEGKDFLGKRQQTCHLDRLTFMSLENANESNLEKTIGLLANKEKKERDNDI